MRREGGESVGWRHVDYSGSRETLPAAVVQGSVLSYKVTRDDLICAVIVI